MQAFHGECSSVRGRKPGDGAAGMDRRSVVSGSGLKVGYGRGLARAAALLRAAGRRHGATTAAVGLAMAAASRRRPYTSTAPMTTPRRRMRPVELPYQLPFAQTRIWRSMRWKCRLRRMQVLWGVRDRNGCR